MKALSIHEAKTHMSKLLSKVDKGEQVVFGARGKAQYQITKLESNMADRSKAFGAWKDRMSVAADAFSSDVDQQIADLLLHELDQESRDN